jgi:hypothetical protein
MWLLTSTGRMFGLTFAGIAVCGIWRLLTSRAQTVSILAGLMVL